MLASSEAGRKILYRIIWENNTPVNLFSYKTYGRLNENILIVLMKEREYDLYNLILNQILIDYYENGFGNLSVIADVLLYLQRENYTGMFIMAYFYLWIVIYI
jgi:hypothetical protein